MYRWRRVYGLCDYKTKRRDYGEKKTKRLKIFGHHFLKIEFTPLLIYAANIIIILTNYAKFVKIKPFLLCRWSKVDARWSLVCGEALTCILQSTVYRLLTFTDSNMLFQGCADQFYTFQTSLFLLFYGVHNRDPLNSFAIVQGLFARKHQTDL